MLRLPVVNAVAVGALKVDASDKSVVAIVMAVLPSNDCPAIFTPVANFVAVSALPIKSPTMSPSVTILPTCIFA